MDDRIRSRPHSLPQISSKPPASRASSDTGSTSAFCTRQLFPGPHGSAAWAWPVSCPWHPGPSHWLPVVHAGWGFGSFSYSQTDLPTTGYRSYIKSGLPKARWFNPASWGGLDMPWGELWPMGNRRRERSDRIIPCPPSLPWTVPRHNFSLQNVSWSPSMPPGHTCPAAPSLPDSWRSGPSACSHAFALLHSLPWLTFAAWLPQ